MSKTMCIKILFLATLLMKVFFIYTGCCISWDSNLCAIARP